MHFNYDFRFNSQSTSAVYTLTRTLGGRAWPSIIFKSVSHQKLFVLWANTTLGVLAYWWRANKTQSGRGTITLSAIPHLPIFDFRQLSSNELEKIDKVFEGLAESPLRPIHEISSDTGRHVLDENVLHAILGMPKTLFVSGGAFDLLRRKLGIEPSIAGGKKL